MITDVDVALAEKLGFIRGSPEYTTKATLIASFRETVIARELAVMVKEIAKSRAPVDSTPYTLTKIPQDADVKAWALYAAALLPRDTLTVLERANIADQMLVEQKKRFPSIP